MHETKRTFGDQPADWPSRRVGEIAERLTRRNTERCNTVLTISAEHGLVSQGEFFNRRVASDDLSPYFVLERGDFAYNRSYSKGYPFGAFRRLEVYPKGVVSPLYLCFRPAATRVCSDFLAQYLDAGILDEGLGLIAKEGVRNHGLLNVGTSDFFELALKLPPLPEQRQIAAILDTIDDAIRKTEQIIAKLKQVKQGLLHDLLTRGIDDNGELRDPERHPEQFKDSLLGRIPRQWNVDTIGNVLAHIIDYRGRTPKKLGMDWGGGDIPALSANNVKTGGVDLSEPTYYGSQALYSRWMTNGDCERGDVLVTMEAPLGNVAQIPDERRYILSQRVVLYRFNRDTMLNDFAAIQMRSEQFQAGLVKRSTGTTATGIQRARFVQMALAVPSVPEQVRLTDAVSSIERRLQAEAGSVWKHRRIKAGLMEDLLTGRVRVTKLVESTAP